jgi:hypothetical protein
VNRRLELTSPAHKFYDAREQYVQWKKESHQRLLETQMTYTELQVCPGEDSMFSNRNYRKMYVPGRGRDDLWVPCLESFWLQVRKSVQFDSETRKNGECAPVAEFDLGYGHAWYAHMDGAMPYRR